MVLVYKILGLTILVYMVLVYKILGLTILVYMVLVYKILGARQRERALCFGQTIWACFFLPNEFWFLFFIFLF